MRSRTPCTSATTSTPPTTSVSPAGLAQRDVQHRALLGRVDRIAAEHRRGALGNAALAREVEKQAHGLVVDPVLRVVEVQAGRIEHHPLAAAGVLREQLAQVAPSDLVAVRGEGAPRRPLVDPSAHAACGSELRGLLAQAGEQGVPRLRERGAAFLLQLRRDRFDVDAVARDRRDDRFGIAAVGRHRRADPTVVGEGEQGLVGHRVDGVGRGEGLDVERVGRGRVLGPGRCPQQALRMRPGGDELLHPRRCEQLAVGLVDAPPDRDAEPVLQIGRHLVLDRGVPAADEERGDRLDLRIEALRDAPLDRAQVRIGDREVLLAREEQGDVDRHAGEDRFLDRRHAGRRARES
jgi:hypothetical protein